MCSIIKNRKKLSPELIDDILNSNNCKKIWEIKNREYVLEYNRNYYKNNKDKFLYINENIFCEFCNCTYQRCHRSRHFKSKKHIKNSNSPVEC